MVAMVSHRSPLLDGTTMLVVVLTRPTLLKITFLVMMLVTRFSFFEITAMLTMMTWFLLPEVTSVVATVAWFAFPEVKTDSDHSGEILNHDCQSREGKSSLKPKIVKGGWSVHSALCSRV
jgi:hypothetical protein